MTKVAICTVNWNGREDTLEFLDSLKRLDTSGLSTKVFVVSNQELFPKKEEFLKRTLLFKKTPLELILKRNNRGSAGGYNDGAKAALKWGADYILLVNNDIVFNSAELLQKLIATAQSDPKIGLVSPKILFAPGYEFYKEKYSKKDIGKIIWYAGGHFDWNNINSIHRGLDEVDNGKYNAVKETSLVSGSAMLVTRTVFERKIFWDEDLFAYLDDNDLQELATRAGFKLYYDGRVSVFHKVSRTSGIGSPVSDYYTTRNRFIFGLRYAPLRTKFALLRLSLRLLLFGRPMQKRGVIDFLLGKRGALDHPIT